MWHFAAATASLLSSFDSLFFFSVCIFGRVRQGAGTAISSRDYVTKRNEVCFLARFPTPCRPFIDPFAFVSTPRRPPSQTDRPFPLASRYIRGEWPPGGWGSGRCLRPRSTRSLPRIRRILVVNCRRYRRRRDDGGNGEKNFLPLVRAGNEKREADCEGKLRHPFV